jgi:hypothetical protein
VGAGDFVEIDSATIVATRSTPGIDPRRREDQKERAMETHRHKSVDELLRSDHYTAEEVAALLEIGVNIVRHAAYVGELPAQIVGHDIISIRREDVIAWYNARDSGDAASS